MTMIVSKKGINMISRPIEILWAEDDPASMTLIMQVFKEKKISHHLHFVYDGTQVLEFLYNEGAFLHSPLPDIIVLDLNMPRKSGHEVLEDIKKNKLWQPIPVIIFTSSQSEHDVIRSYVLNANCHITKPFEYEDFVNVIKLIEEFWFKYVSLP
jgi:chemotaxis family two-component system response regulator Rcp1